MIIVKILDDYFEMLNELSPTSLNHQAQDFSEANTYLFNKGKYHCTAAGLQFN